MALGSSFVRATGDRLYRAYSTAPGRVTRKDAPSFSSARHNPPCWLPRADLFTETNTAPFVKHLPPTQWLGHDEASRSRDVGPHGRVVGGEDLVLRLDGFRDVLRLTRRVELSARCVQGSLGGETRHVHGLPLWDLFGHAVQVPAPAARPVSELGTAEEQPRTGRPRRPDELWLHRSIFSPSTCNRRVMGRCFGDDHFGGEPGKAHGGLLSRARRLSVRCLAGHGMIVTPHAQ
jgi:hypothetical protein